MTVGGMFSRLPMRTPSVRVCISAIGPFTHVRSPTKGSREVLLPTAPLFRADGFPSAFPFSLYSETMASQYRMGKKQVKNKKKVGIGNENGLPAGDGGLAAPVRIKTMANARDECVFRPKEA